MLNLSKLRMVDGPGMPRLWNRLLDELQANTLVSAASPLLLSKDTGGLRLGLNQSVSGSTGAGTMLTATVDAVTGTGSTATYDLTTENGEEFAAVALADAVLSADLTYGEFAEGDSVLVWNNGTDDPLIFTTPPVELEEVTYMTDVRIDTVSGEFQKKTQTVKVPSAQAVSDWTKIEDTEESKAIECTEPGS
jgi:hypothetical protein